MSWIFLNDRFVRQEEAVVSVFDHGFLYGDGVYETLRAYDRKISCCAAPCRLERSSDPGLELPLPKGCPRCSRGLERNDIRDAYLRITVSRAKATSGWIPLWRPPR